MAGDRWIYLLIKETKLQEASEDILIKIVVNIGDILLTRSRFKAKREEGESKSE